jgi:ABC-type multidrug transport system fused ATPase/permease subunit
VTESVGEKYSNIIFSVTTLLSGVGISFYYGADFAAVCAAFLPIILILTGIFGSQVRKMTKLKMKAVKKLGGAIEEILTAVRLIASYANENIEAEKFRRLAGDVRDITHKQEFWLAITIGIFKFFIFLYYVYAFYIASIYLEKGYGNPNYSYKKYETGTLLTIFISFMTGMLMIFGLTPNI